MPNEPYLLIMWSQNKWLSLFLILLLTNSVAMAQDLFDCTRTARYARYLFEAQEYDKAANEYERLQIICDSSVVIPQLFAAYRRGGQYSRLNQRIGQLFPLVNQSPAFVSLERLKLALLTERYAQADSLMTESTTCPADEIYYRLKHQVLTNQWPKARHQLTLLDTGRVANQRDWATLIRQGEEYRAKSPLLAASLSVIVPGLGKGYARDWKDAVVSLIFVGSFSYQAYRSFNRQPNGAMGWALATVGAGFYLGNIYGAYKSARQYNQRRLTRLHNEAKRLSFLDF
jgi:hypothetical protein